MYAKQKKYISANIYISPKQTYITLQNKNIFLCKTKIYYSAKQKIYISPKQKLSLSLKNISKTKKNKSKICQKNLKGVNKIE